MKWVNLLQLLQLVDIRQKGESKNGCCMKTKHAKFSEKRIFLNPDTHTYQGIFWKIWQALFSCYLCFEVRLFALLPTNLISRDSA